MSSDKDLDDTVIVFRNCTVLRNHELTKQDFWVRGGKIVDPEILFFDENRTYDQEHFCEDGDIIAPGFIDLQINGAFGVDFTTDVHDRVTAEKCLRIVGNGILAHGVTSYAPTIVTSESTTYKEVLPHFRPQEGGVYIGAEILGAHVEGPFICRKKKGAHTEEFIRDLSQSSNPMETIQQMYGSLSNVRIITLAPEQLTDGGLTVRQLTSMGVTVSLGHSSANLTDGEESVREGGARMITHLFNAMASFHHRDPGLVGLLTSKKLNLKDCYYGLIADGIHTHPAALRLAYRTNFQSLCLVTDAMGAMGLKDGEYRLGEQTIEVRGYRAVIQGTDTLAGAILPLSGCIEKLIKNARCSLVEALEAASLHPARAINIEEKKGALNFGSDADFVILRFSAPRLTIKSTWIAGKCVFRAKQLKRE